MNIWGNVNYNVNMNYIYIKMVFNRKKKNSKFYYDNVYKRKNINNAVFDDDGRL